MRFKWERTMVLRWDVWLPCLRTIVVKGSTHLKYEINRTLIRQVGAPELLRFSTYVFFRQSTRFHQFHTFTPFTCIHVSPDQPSPFVAIRQSHHHYNHSPL